MKFYFYGKLYSPFGLRKYVVHIFFLVMCLSISFFIAGNISALTVSPVKAELSADPGETLQSEMSLLNEQSQTMTFYSSFENFEPQGESGTPNFVPAKEGLATWMKAPISITLTPQEKQTIPFSINVPLDAEPGGHFSAIFWSATPPDPKEGSEQVAVDAKIGTLVLLKVSGDIKEGGGIVDFVATNKKTWFDALPVEFTYRFQNSGGDRVKPLGAVTIKNMFGGISAVINANALEGNVLPASTRKFTIVWTGQEQGNDNNPQTPAIEDNDSGFFTMAKKEWGQFAFGSYVASLHLNYGGSNEADATYRFFIIPWQLLSIALVILIILTCIAVISIKKYNRWIIARSRGR